MEKRRGNKGDNKGKTQGKQRESKGREKQKGKQREKQRGDKGKNKGKKQNENPPSNSLLLSLSSNVRSLSWAEERPRDRLPKSGLPGQPPSSATPGLPGPQENLPKEPAPTVGSLANDSLCDTPLRSILNVLVCGAVGGNTLVKQWIACGEGSQKGGNRGATRVQPVFREDG